MNDEGIIPPPLQGSALGAQLASLAELYERIEFAQRGFRTAAAAAGKPITCPAGCGTCCEGFVPDVLPIEAAYLAAFIIGRRPDLACRPLSPNPPCPFYEAERPEAHCAVYAGRPLICRLFAFSASIDKSGKPSFALCRRMPALADSGARAWTGDAILQAFGALPPAMPSFAAEVLGLDPIAAGERQSLDAALPRALSRLSLALRFAASDDDPEPNAPAPRAA